MPSRGLRAFLLVATLLPATPKRSAAPHAGVAAPRIIMFYGGVLDGRRYMTDWNENLRFLGAASRPAPEGTARAGRALIEVALFWGYYPTDSASLRNLGPDSAQAARLYLGDKQHPPVFDYYSAGSSPGPRSISPVGLEILSRHRVPLYADQSRR